MCAFSFFSPPERLITFFVVFGLLIFAIWPVIGRRVAHSSFFCLSGAVSAEAATWRGRVESQHENIFSLCTILRSVLPVASAAHFRRVQLHQVRDVHRYCKPFGTCAGES